MSQKIIEIIGPPGIGKSTFYKFLCKRWKPSYNWTYQDKLLAPDKPKINDFKNWLTYKSKRILGKKLSTSLSTDLGLRFINHNPELAGFYWKLLSDPLVYDKTNVDSRFRAAYFLFQDFCRYQAVMEKPNNKPCLMNEGLLQKAFFTQLSKLELEEKLNEYMNIIPNSIHAIIYLSTPNTGIILERLLHRDKVIASHIGKKSDELLVDIKNWQYMLDLIVEKAKTKGIRVFKIDGADELSINSEYIMNALDSYSISK